MTTAELNILIRVTAAQARKQIQAMRAEIAALQAQAARMGTASAAGMASGSSAAMRQQAQATATATAGTTAYTNAVRKAGGQHATFAKQQSQVENAMGRLRVAELRHGETLANTRAKTSQVIASEERLAAARRNVGLAQMGLADAQAKHYSGLTNETDKAVKAQSKLGDKHTLNRLRTLGATTTWAGKQIGLAFTTPLLLAGAMAFKWQMDNEAAATHVTKVYDGLVEHIDSDLQTEGFQFEGSPLDKYFTALSEKMGETQADVTAIGGMWAQVGATGESLANATRLTTEAMILGNMTAEEAANALVAIQAQYRLAIGSLDEFREGNENLTGVLAQLNIIENQTGASMQDLVTAFAQTAAQARQAGVDAATLGGHIAALVPSMGSAARAGNALKTLYARILAPATKDAAAALEQIATNAGLATDSFLSAEFHAGGMGKGFESLADAYAQLEGSQKIQWAQEVFGIYQYGRGMQLLEDISLRSGAALEGQASGVQTLADEYAALRTETEKQLFAINAFGGEEFAQAATDAEKLALAASGIGAEDITNGINSLEKAAKGAAEGLSYYDKAMQGATDTAKSADTYMTELNTVLESNPRKFKQVGVILQNAMTDIIVPLIPYIYWLAKAVAGLVKSFSQLDPTLQKWIIVAALAVAAVGPLAVVLGSFILLGSYLGKMFKSTGRLLSMLAFQFLGVRTGAYKAEEAMKRTALVTKIFNGMKAAWAGFYSWISGASAKNAATQATHASTGALATVNANNSAMGGLAAGSAAGMQANATILGSGAASSSAAFAAGIAGVPAVAGAASATAAGTFASGMLALPAAAAAGTSGAAAAAAIGMGVLEGEIVAGTSAAAATTAITMGIIEGEVVSMVYNITGALPAGMSRMNTQLAIGWKQTQAIEASNRKQLIAGASANMKALEANTTGHVGKVVALYQRGGALMTTAVQQAQIAITRIFVASQQGQVAAFNIFTSELTAAQTARNAAQMAQVQAQATALGRIFMATESGHIAAITGATPAVVAAQRNQGMAQLAAASTSQKAIMSAEANAANARRAQQAAALRELKLAETARVRSAAKVARAESALALAPVKGTQNFKKLQDELRKAEDLHKKQGARLLAAQEAANQALFTSQAKHNGRTTSQTAAAGGAQASAVAAARPALTAAQTGNMLAIEAATTAAIPGSSATMVANMAGQVTVVRASAPALAAAQGANMAAQVATIAAAAPAAGAAMAGVMAAEIAAVRAAAPALAAAQASASAGAGGAAALGAGAAARGRSYGDVVDGEVVQVRDRIKKMDKLKELFRRAIAWIPGIGPMLLKIFSRLGGWIAKGFSAVVGFFGKGIGGMAKAIAGIGSKIGGVVAGLAARLGIMIPAALTGPIGWAIIAAVTLVMMFPKQIGQALRNAWEAIKGIAERIFGGESDVPLLARPFVFALEVIKSALLALPKLVVDVFNAVVKIIQKAAMLIYEFFSYLNPFQRHSPSLVENVQNGMAVVTGEFSDASKSIQNSIHRAYRSIASFGRATAGMEGMRFDYEQRDIETKLNTADPSGGSLAGYRALEAEQARLEGQLKETNKLIKDQEKVIEGMERAVKQADLAIEGMNKTLEGLEKAAEFAQEALNRAQDQLDRYSSARIKGLREAEDAIFENEMAQKRLNLAIMDMETSGVDDAADKFARLQGEIENLQGTRDELRLAGAGSEITGVYDSQIASLRAQQQVVEQNKGPLEELNAELERLQSQAERMDLEKSLAFDPLTRQLEQLKDTTEEMSFEQIVGGITSSKAAVAGATAAYDLATLAVDNQKAAIEAATEARDAMSASIEVEQEKLADAQKTYDLIEQAINDVTAAQQRAIETADFLIQRWEEEARAAEEAAKKAKEAAEGFQLGEGMEMEIPGGTFSIDEGNDIDALTQQLLDDLNSSFKGIDLFGPIKNAWNKFTEWLGNAFSGMWDWIAGIFTKDGAAKIGGFFASLPGMLYETITYLGGWLAGAIVRVVWEGLKALFNLGQWIVDMTDQAFGAVVTWIKGGGFGRLWDTILEGIKNAWSGIINWITNDGSRGIWEGITSGIWSFIKGIGTWLWDNLVQPFINGFKDGFGIHSPSTVMFDLAVNIIEGILNGLLSAVEWVFNFFRELPGKVFDAIGDFYGMMVNFWAGVFNFLVEKLPGIAEGVWNFFRELPGKIVDILGNAGSWLYDFGKNMVQGLIDGAGSLLSKLGEFFLDKVPDFIKEPFKKALGIKSPSRVFAEYGKNTGEGFVNGVNNMAPAVQAATQNLADSAMNIELKDVIAQPTVAAPVTSVKAPTEGIDDKVIADTMASAAAWDAFEADLAAGSVGLNSTVSMNTGLMTSATLTNITGMVAGSNGQLTAWSAASNTIMTGLKDSGTATTKMLADNVGKNITNMKDSMVSTVEAGRDATVTAFDTMSQQLTGIFDDGIKPVFDAFQPMLENVEGWFSDTVGNIGKTWDGIKEPVAVPARFVINDVYNDGIRGAWNKFNNFLDLPELGEHVARFATGGPVFGRGTGTSDSIPALLSNQEHVVTAKEVRGAGGHGAVEATRRMWAEGKVPAFAKGGPVDLNAAPWPGGGGESNLQPAAILARRNIKKYWPEIQTIGGYRAQDAYPDHPSGLALDVMTGDPLGTEINEWLHREKDALALNYTIWKQWYRPAGGHGNLMEDRGSVTQNHYDHIHALFNANGVAGIQAGGVGSMPMDQVIKEAINRKMDEVRDRIPQRAGDITKWMPNAVEKARNQLLDFMVPRAVEMAKARSAAGVHGNAESWRGMAIEAMKRQGFAYNNEEQVNAMLRQIMSESSGNPSAIQQVIDVNSGGNEAAGLLQIIPSTYATHRDPELVNDRLDAWSNMNAALRYYKATYGMDLTTMWGHGHGYDKGGMLPPTPNGYGTYYNHTGKPEVVLTDGDWKAIYAAANNPVTAEMVQEGVVAAEREVYGHRPVDVAASKQALALATEIKGANDPWIQEIYGATSKVGEANEEIAKSVGQVETGLEKFTRVGNSIQTTIADLSTVMLAVAAAVTQYGETGQVTFGMVAPVLNAIGDMLGKLPEADPTYVPWERFDVVMTPEMKRQKALNDASNVGKGLYNIFRSVAPAMLKHTAAIGSAIEQIAISQGPIISAAIAMMPTNPVGAAIMLIPAILQSIFTVVPLIIAAIMDIVPSLLTAIMNFFNRFMPDSVYSYDSAEAAAEAVARDTQAIKDGTYLASKGVNQPGQKIEQPVNNSTVINVYGDLSMPNITNGNDAEKLVTNLESLAG